MKYRITFSPTDIPSYLRASLPVMLSGKFSNYIARIKPSEYFDEKKIREHLGITQDISAVQMTNLRTTNENWLTLLKSVCYEEWGFSEGIPGQIKLDFGCKQTESNLEFCFKAEIKLDPIETSESIFLVLNGVISPNGKITACFTSGLRSWGCLEDVKESLKPTKTYTIELEN